MKFAKLVYLLTILCFTKESTTYGQNQMKRNEPFPAGRWQIDLNDGLGKGNELSRFVNSQEVCRYNIIQAQAGYYVVNRLLIGIGFTWSREWSTQRVKEESFTDFMKGPLIRYQFTNSKVSPFLAASYQVGRRNTGPHSLLDYVGSSVHSALLSGGISIGLTSHLRVDASYGIQFKTFINQSIIHHYPQVGINYVFGSKWP